MITAPVPPPVNRDLQKLLAECLTDYAASIRHAEKYERCERWASAAYHYHRAASSAMTCEDEYECRLNEIRCAELAALSPNQKEVTIS